MHNSALDYELLDSGERAKLERFGSKILIRPSSFSIWKRRLDAAKWQSAHSSFDPKGGWKKVNFEDWQLAVGDLKLKLRLQDNGQIGFFPEHVSYLEEVETLLHKIKADGRIQPRVLNLFAYTGLASLVCIKAGAQVVHVDISKRVLDWACQNLELNQLNPASLRLIQEDAMAFLAREVRREKRYDIILADPPSFSRVSGKKTWTLEEVLPELIGSCLDLIDPQGGAFFLTSHQYEYGSEVLCNLIRDAVAAKQRQAQVSGKNLLLTESSGERSLPAGFLACCLGGDPHGC